MCLHDCQCEPAPLPWEAGWQPEHDAVDPVGAQLAADDEFAGWSEGRHEAAVADEMVRDAFARDAA